MIYWIVFGVLAALIIGYRFRPGGKYREMAKGHDRCGSCKGSLKWTNGQYAEVCPKCGVAQSH
jgi:rubredoxin